MDYAVGGSRNKKKDKMREKKRNPYKAGGKFRAMDVEELDNTSKKVVNVKKQKAKRLKRLKRK